MSDLDEQISLLRKQIVAGNSGDARWRIEKLLKRHPQNPAVLSLAAFLQFRSANPAQGLEMLRQAVRQIPNSALLREDFALALSASGHRDLAIEQFREAIRLDPNRALSLEHAANYLAERDSWEECETILRHLTAIQPDIGEHWNKLGWALVTTGRLAEAETLFRRAQNLSPDAPHIGSNLALISNYRDDLSPADVLAIHREWNDRYVAKSEIIANFDLPTGRKLRIGYVSADFRAHAINSFFEPILIHHDKMQFEIICYSNFDKADHVTKRLQSHASAWRNIFGVPDDDALRMIREDRVDVLVDLSGHTGGNRLTLFARQAAPVQMTYLGYPNTTGVPAIQYRLTDAIADPPGMTDAHFVEKLARLPDSFLCYQPDETAPTPLAQTPARETGTITFGSFNGFVKVTDRMMEFWVKILHAVPNSRVLIKSRGLDVPIARARIRDLFSRNGIADNRVTIMDWIPAARRHAVVASVDIALDSFPYHGTTTTCEVLWMGVPWITLAGSTHASRVGASILTNIGCPELIADSENEYLDKAVALANDLPRLDEYRRALRARMKSSALMNALQFVRNLETIYGNAMRELAQRRG